MRTASRHQAQGEPMGRLVWLPFPVIPRRSFEIERAIGVDGACVHNCASSDRPGRPKALRLTRRRFDGRRPNMDLTALFLSRLQFAFTVSFHIIFPSFTIGLAAWLCVLEGLHLVSGRPVYRVLFEFWLKIFGGAFGLGVVSGIVMAFQFGTNWSTFSRFSGPIQGPLLVYETFWAFMLEASFFGVLIFGRRRVPPWFYLFSTAMVALGT